MILNAPAKINIGLHILRKRSDGFHDLESLMYPLPFADLIEIRQTEEAGIRFSSSGIHVPGKLEENLCMKACSLFQAFTGQKLNLSIHLHKQIPIGAGLGGGSSNAAAVLRALNSLTGDKLGIDELASLAAQLGSDCPLFIFENAMHASGRGEILKSAALTLRGYYLVLCNPGIMIPTAEAYSRVIPFSDRQSLENELKRTVSEWKDHVVNDFELSIFPIHPEIKRIKRDLYEAGAMYASMSGSGSSVYGIFKSPPGALPALNDSLLWEGSL